MPCLKNDWLVVTGTMEFYDFPFSWEKSSQLTKSYFSDGQVNHQADEDFFGIANKNDAR